MRKCIFSFFSNKKIIVTFLAIFLLLSIIVIRVLHLQKQRNPSLSPLLFTGTTTDLTQFVNPFIGTAHSTSPWHDSGDTFPGAVYPMGLMQWSPDTTTKQPGGYYYPDNRIRGFSATHFSGRGCNVYQDFPFMPYVGSISSSPATNAPAYYATFSHNNEVARPGYYKVHLDNSHVTVELTVTPRTGFGQFTYPASKNSTMLINASGSIKGVTASSISITDNNQVAGSATSTVGCGTEHYTVYFAAQFDQAFSSFGTWNGGAVNHGSKSSSGKATGAFVTFDTTSKQTIHARVGISFVNIANARLNIQSENASSDFATIMNKASSAWNQRLASVTVQGGSDDEKTIFYTALYHVFIHPNIFNDANGQYMGFDKKAHTITGGHNHYTNIPGWDQYRSYARLLALLAPSETSDIAQSLVDDAQLGDGHLPRWVQANVDSLGMIGDSASAYISSAYALGAQNFDTQGALSAMLNGQGKVREGLSNYQTLGYVTSGTSDNSAAMTLEYVNDDYSIAQFAKALGDATTHDAYVKRSQNWQKLFNTNSGYIQPKDSSGNFASGFNPTSETGFREGNSAQYTWMVPFDLATLFSKMGGVDKAIQRLDNHFTKLNDGPKSQYAFIGNEPEFEVPWEYDFAGTPYKTQDVVRRIQLQLFTNTPGGLPGNDDAGAMSSWYLFSAIGLYPEIPGVGGFAVGSPLFSQTTISLGNGKTLQINGNDASDKNQYLQSLTINTQLYTNPWIPYEMINNGAVIAFSLGNTPNVSWGNTIALKPSISPFPSVIQPSPTTIDLSPTQTPAPAPEQKDTFLSLQLILPGIGGNNGNPHPLHPLRDITIVLYNLTTKALYKTKNTILFDGTYFTASTLTLGQLPTGYYQIFVRVNGYLTKRITSSDGSSTHQITSGTTISPPPNILVPGDIAPQSGSDSKVYGNNQLDLNDYNTFLGCYGTSQCLNKTAADFDDDGIVDATDYNFLLRGFAVSKQGDIIPGGE